MRFPRTGTTLVAEGEHYLAATSRRQRYQGVQDCRPQRSRNERRIHVRDARTSKRTHPPHPAETCSNNESSFLGRSRHRHGPGSHKRPRGAACHYSSPIKNGAAHSTLASIVDGVAEYGNALNFSIVHCSFVDELEVALVALRIVARVSKLGHVTVT